MLLSLSRGDGLKHAPNYSMKLLAWNCRGFARLAAKLAFKGFLKNYNTDFIFLSETKILESKIKPFLSHLGFTNLLYKNPVRKAGGICFA